MKQLLSLFLLVLCGLLPLSAEARDPAPEAPRSEASATAQARAARVYVLGPNDEVHIRVYQEEDLETRARIGQDGTITFPLLGSVNIGGRTLEQAAAVIRELLAADYLVNPQVSVAVSEYAKRRFTVLGQVQRPGAYEIPFEESITLVQAIAMAGGYTRLGAPWKITVQRTAGDRKQAFKLDAAAMARDKNAKPFEILPDDIITIGEKWI
jgi:protein involved in polysaccharide export with SLBB domain